MAAYNPYNLSNSNKNLFSGSGMASSMGGGAKTNSGVDAWGGVADWSQPFSGASNAASAITNAANTVPDTTTTPDTTTPDATTTPTPVASNNLPWNQQYANMAAAPALAAIQNPPNNRDLVSSWLTNNSRLYTGMPSGYWDPAGGGAFAQAFPQLDASQFQDLLSPYTQAHQAALASPEYAAWSQTPAGVEALRRQSDSTYGNAQQTADALAEADQGNRSRWNSYVYDQRVASGQQQAGQPASDPIYFYQ